MSATTKTLDLLSYFSVARPEIGLSQLCRLAQRDKATTHRHLQALEEAGFVEQNPATRQYRLGPVLLHLAQIREVTVPRRSGAEAALSRLARETGETAHVSVLSGTSMYPLASRESQRHSTRVIIDKQKFPLHATASGLCALAFGPVDLLDAAMERLEVFTPHTIAAPDALGRAVQAIRDSGFGAANRSFEDEVASIAAPIFDPTGHFAGAVSIASVATRFTPELADCMRRSLMTASREITRNWGGTIPECIEISWGKSLSRPTALEATS